MVNFNKYIIIFSIGISSIQNVAFASVENFSYGWFIGNLDAICLYYQKGRVSEQFAKDHFKLVFNIIDTNKDLSKKYKDKLYRYSDSEKVKACEKFIPY